MLLLGSGELGKEVVLEAQRLGIETIAVDRYANAPAMQVAHRSHVVDMADAVALRLPSPTGIQLVRIVQEAQGKQPAATTKGY